VTRTGERPNARSIERPNVATGLYNLAKSVFMMKAMKTLSIPVVPQPFITYPIATRYSNRIPKSDLVSWVMNGLAGVDT
jgi:hypothetical protein